MPKTTQWGALRPKLIAVSVAACFALSSPQTSANPTGPSVVSGAASFAAAGNSLTITNSANAILNWQAFSIGANEITRFIQPSALSAVLNRVVGSGGAIPRSVIDGILSSNGRVFLLNPGGIIVGKGATIDTAGILLSSLNLSNQDFLNGRLRFTEVPGAGAVVNNGVIQTAAGGNVYLIAPTVENNGLIRSPQGEIVLAAGKSVELVADSSPYVTVRVTADTEQAVNVGSLIADSGRVGVYGALVRNSGVAEANGAVTGEGGQIRFVATKDLNIEAGSRISANGGAGGNVLLQAEGGSNLIAGTVEATGSSGKGGTVQALGVRVGVIGHGVIDASGETGGGTVLVGGDYQGKNPGIQNAQSTEIGADGVIRADARTAGDGGRVIVWADGDTKFAGTISARGGAQSGNGGFVETSGKQHLTATGRVNAGAPNGKNGEWLLDPFNEDIDAGEAAAFGASMAYGTNVSVLADNDINFGASIAGAGTGSFNAQAGNNVNLFSQTITAGTGSVNLTANAYGGGTGSITSTIGGATQITTNGGSVNLNGFGVTVGGIVTRGANGASPGASGRSGGSVNISAYGGAVSTGAINTSGGNGADGANSAFGYGGSGGSGGGVQVCCSASSITTGSITSTGGSGGNGFNGFTQTGDGSYQVDVSGGSGGGGGFVSLHATGAVNVNGTIDASSGAGGNGGTGTINVNVVGASVSAYVDASGGSSGHASSVNLSGGTVNVQNIVTSGGAGGRGGIASVTVSGTPTSVSANAYAEGGPGGAGSSVDLSANAALTVNGAINASGARGGDGGTAIVSVTTGPGGSVSASADANGASGGHTHSVFLSGGSTISAGDVSVRGGDGGLGGSATVGVSGASSIEAYAYASGGRGNDGQHVAFGSSGHISAGTLDTRGANGGAGGTASVTASNVGVEGSVYASAYANGGDGGEGGSVSMFSGSLASISVAGNIFTMGGTGGNGGNASVSVSGSDVSYVNAIASANGGRGGNASSFYGGSALLFSNGPITAGAFNLQGGNGGNGGSAVINVSGASGTVFANAYANGGQGGNSGNSCCSFYGGGTGSATLFSMNSSISAGAINAFGGTGGNGGTAAIVINGTPGSVSAHAWANGGSGGSALSASYGGGVFFYGGLGGVSVLANGPLSVGAISAHGGRGGNGGIASVMVNGAGSGQSFNDAGHGGDGGDVFVSGTGEVKINLGGSRFGMAIDTSGGAGGAGGPGSTSRAGRGGDGGHGGAVQVAGIPNISLVGSINSSGGAGGAGGSGNASNLGGDGGDGGLGGDIALDAGHGAGSIFVFVGTTFNLSQGAGGAGGSPGGLPGSTAFDGRPNHSGPGILSILGQIVPFDPLSEPEVLAAVNTGINETLKLDDKLDPDKKKDKKDKDKEDFTTCKP
jgi:filamentous hemagglutinin family protein